ncbi:MAG: STAS domain-containing protein [Melioribacteraceae bacterium]
MFDIKINEGKEVFLIGKLNASCINSLQEGLDSIKSNCTVDLSELTYISSAGLGEFVKSFTRLEKSGNSIKLVNMNNHIKEVFKYCGLDKVFIIE